MDSLGAGSLNILCKKISLCVCCFKFQLKACENCFKTTGLVALSLCRCVLKLPLKLLRHLIANDDIVVPYHACLGYMSIRSSLMCEAVIWLHKRGWSFFKFPIQLAGANVLFPLL